MMLSTISKHRSSSLIILITIVSISAAARTHPSSSSSHSSFHTLPAPPSFKLRSTSSQPEAMAQPASGHTAVHAVNHKLDANAHRAATFGDYEPDPKSEEDFDEDEMDEGDVVGAVSRTFDPAEGSAAAGVLALMLVVISGVVACSALVDI
jgi:hypothetical protein